MHKLILPKNHGRSMWKSDVRRYFEERLQNVGNVQVSIISSRKCCVTLTVLRPKFVDVPTGQRLEFEHEEKHLEYDIEEGRVRAVVEG